MTLSEYIKSIGDDKAAALFNVKVRTVASWRYGERTPRPDQANQIVKATNGAVTMDGIYKKAA